MKLNVNEFSLTKQEDILIFCMNHETTGDYFILMRNFDKDMNFDKSIYTEINDQFFGGYGLQKEIIIGAKSIQLIVNEKGMKELKKSRIEIFIDEDKIDKLPLENALREFYQESKILKFKK